MSQVLMAVCWHGTKTESELLLAAIARNCACEFDKAGARTATCAPHKALIEDQRFADGLLFALKIRARLLREEFRCA